MSAKHTPGPWQVEADDDETRVTAEKGATWVCIVIDAHTYGSRAPEADARLIAAAPDLLAALRVLADAHEMLFHPKDRIRQANKVADVAMARAAIAKAEGGA